MWKEMRGTRPRMTEAAKSNLFRHRLLEFAPGVVAHTSDDQCRAQVKSSPRSTTAKYMVSNGETLEIMAVEAAPIFAIPALTKKLGTTVASNPVAAASMK